MKYKNKSLKTMLSLFVTVLMFFSNVTIALAAEKNVQPDNNSKYVLAYYDIATGVETMLTAKDAKIRFGIDINPETQKINTKPSKLSEKVTEKYFTEAEKKEIESANEKSIKNLYNFDRNIQPGLWHTNSNIQTTSADPETRTLVSNQNLFPYYCIAKIYDGNNWKGTGFAVGLNLMATARHCVQNGTEWASSVTAYFGYNNNKNTYTYTYKANNAIGYIYYPTSEITNELEDWAFVVWGTDTVYSTGCFGMDGSAYTGMPIKTAGYPQDLNNGNNMYECSGTILTCRDYDFECNLRVYNGQSGSPVYHETAGGPYVIAIMTRSWFPVNGTNRSLARSIDSGIIGWLQDNGYV